MLNFCSLYSGSSGNCLFVETQSTKILVDCGTSGKKVCEGLSAIGKDITDIDAILVTHEHSDHIQSLGLISKKYDIPVYANLETWNAMASQKNKIKNLDNINSNTSDMNVDNYNYDYYINNDGTLEDFEEKAKEFLENIKTKKL